MGWNPFESIADTVSDAFNSVADFFSDPLGALEDVFNATLEVFSLGTFSYLKDTLRAFVAGLVPEQDYQDRQRTVRSATAPREVIYGRVRTGGQLVYIEDDGKDKVLLWQCFVLAAHEVEEITGVYADDELVAQGDGTQTNGIMTRPANSFGDNTLCWAVHGNRSTAFIPSAIIDYSDDSYDGTFSPPSWTSSHKLSFQSYVWVLLIFDKETFGDTGMPKLTFDVKGKNDLYDPRTATSGYSDNQALVLLDVIRWSRMFNVPDADIDMPSFVTAANIADELVASGVGTTEKRYTANGTFKLQATPLEIMNSIANAGASFPVYSQGQWSVVPGKFSAPVMGLDESDLVGGLSFQPGPGKSGRHNSANGTYIDADQNYEAVGFPELSVGTYITEDGEVLEQNLDFAWTNSGTMARRLAKIEIERSRYGTSVSLVAKFKALRLTPGDRINLTITRLGWSPKVFRVEAVEVSFSTGVKLELREDAAAVYDWEEGDALALDSPPAISIPDGMEISAPSGIAFTEEVFLSTGGEPRTQLNITWNDQPSAAAYDVQYREQGATPWIDAASFWQDNAISIRDVTDGIYDIRIRAISRIGLRSAWTQVQHTVDGLTALPVDAIDLTELPYTPKDPDAVYSTVVVQVVPPSDPDFAYADIEYRQVGEPEWKVAGPTDDNQSIRVVLESDGSQYEFRAFSVATTGIRSSAFVTSGITLSNATDFEEPNIWDQIDVPPVHGLELFGQGNDTEFGGRDAKFEWRKTTVEQWLPIGSEGFAGASGGNLDQYFRDYQVEVWADNKIVRTEFVFDPLYTYTYEKNAEDYKREKAVRGAWRDFELRVYCRSRVGSLSEKAARLSVSNTPPEPLSALSAIPGYSVIEIAYLRPDDLDFAGVDIWISQTQGFDPDATEPTATVSDNSYVAGGLEDGTTYYVRLRPFDDFGKTGTNTSAEFTVITKTAQDLSGLSGWAYEVDPLDRTFIENNLQNDAVPSEKVVSLTAAKITTGTLLATETITSEGLIRSVDDINSPQYQTGLGPLTIDGVTYLMWGYNAGALLGDKLRFGIDELGNAYFRGEVEASSFTNDELTIDVDGNLTSTGTFRFGGASSEFVEFDGANLEISTPEFTLLNGNATFGGALAAATGVFGDEGTGEYIKYENGIFEVGPNATIGSNANRTVTVGTGKDFTTINDALEYLSRTIPAYVRGGFEALVLIDSGHSESAPLHFSGVDMGWITLRCTTTTGVVTISPGAGNFIVRADSGAKSPTIDCSITAASVSNRTVIAEESSTIKFAFRSIAEDQIIVDCGGASNSGLWADSGSMIVANRIRVNGTDSSAVVSVNGATILMISGTISSYRDAISADSGDVVFRNGEFIDSIDGSLGVLAEAYRGGIADIGDSTISGVTPGSGVFASIQGIVEATNVSFGSGYFSELIRASRSGTVNAMFSSGSTSATAECEVAAGGIVNVGSTSYTDFSQTPNTLTANGIIFN